MQTATAAEQGAAPYNGTSLRWRPAVCSWYGWEHAGKRTASGEKFDPMKLTCASWHHPFGTRIAVRMGSKSVVVTVNDRGPAKRLKRDLDLSLAAFSKICHPDAGVIHAEMMVLK